MKTDDVRGMRLWHGEAFRMDDKIRQGMYIVCGCCVEG